MITAKLCVITDPVTDIDVFVDESGRLNVQQSTDIVWIHLDDAEELIAAVTEVVERHKAATAVKTEPSE